MFATTILMGHGRTDGIEVTMKPFPHVQIGSKSAAKLIRVPLTRDLVTRLSQRMPLGESNLLDDARLESAPRKKKGTKTGFRLGVNKRPNQDRFRETLVLVQAAPHFRLDVAKSSIRMMVVAEADRKQGGITVKDYLLKLEAGCMAVFATSTGRAQALVFNEWGTRLGWQD